VSVNDVVMAMCAGALRRWLLDHDALPDQPLVAMIHRIPSGIRPARERWATGCPRCWPHCPPASPIPGLRLEIVHSATKVAKAQQAAIPQGLVDQISDFAVPALTARAARVVFATGVLHRPAAVQPHDLQRPRAERPGLPVRRPATSRTTRSPWSPTARA